MIPNISSVLCWLKCNPNILDNITRGIERETLRIKIDGNMPTTNHPYQIGSSLTHKWITTDFSEILLEFVTPKSTNLNNLIDILYDLHKYTSENIKNEYLWPFSFPYYITPHCAIKLAKYGTSNLGKIKTLYRTGLKNRYGSLMNMISGVHYNFSLSINFWKQWKNITNIKNIQNIISSEYFKLIRNYHKFGWIIPYLFGASPVIEPSFIKNKKSNITFKKSPNNLLYLPWSTSLRLSSIGYNNSKTSDIMNVSFNNLTDYINSLKNAINTPSEIFKKIGLKNKLGNFKQISNHLLQMESEFYTHIRPKQKTTTNESLLNTLKNKGIEYIEIRSLDINPFSPIGIDIKQILFLDLFLIWCLFANSSEIHNTDIKLYNNNWNIILLEGRKPNQMINVDGNKKKEKLISIGKIIFHDLYHIAENLDKNSKNNPYEKVCDEFIQYFKEPELTYSGKIFNEIITNGINETGLKLARKYKKQLIDKKMKFLNYKILYQEAMLSHKKRQNIEIHDKINFKTYLKRYKKILTK
ncbi:glutamate--cysteine ligase [Buchnera aphidicola (Formosaphis micheliae)]|uniref:glutamate--cysteine ligase n=1 Tax=Buchnera aphidicola TaxID=9 RepID=UPI0031CC401D